MNSVEQVKAKFSADLAEMLTFEDSGDYVILRLKRCVELDVFAKIARIVKDHKGEWVSLGAKSHFKIPKATTAPNRDSQISDVFLHIERAEAELKQAKEKLKEVE